MGPDAAVNAVYAGKIAELSESERAAFVAEKIAEYQAEIDIFKEASELIVDDVVEPTRLRNELLERFAFYEGKRETTITHKIYPM
ncbi:propionyl-CoA carboxylase [Listeria floridensis FSL S10-1187]|uniref:Propionyl-CoA carboxylase n=1 Tax=Listeria floridensis FSL S10-1187 TaxID=1265817 RepID=A0ABN0RBV1_9LIST|nr:propionyl-CoA carboxylase [Listeria floridensis FSL S10-1187]